MRVVHFYRDGFLSMTIGKKLWLIIIIKLVVMFGVFRLFFFHDDLSKHASDRSGKTDYVLEQLTR
jgi:hypothetical protein